MQRVRPLDELTPADLWREVAEREDEFWRDTLEKQLRLLKVLLDGTLEEEMTVLLGASRFRRAGGWQGPRNGFYERDLPRRSASSRRSGCREGEVQCRSARCSAATRGGRAK